MNYYVTYLAYVLVSLAATTALFLWAVRSGQFRDQQRARFLPLAGEAPVASTPETARWPRWMVLASVLALSGFAALAAVLFVSLAMAR
jgi:cbb3-type cytochrome oxidase maturation protein